MSNTLHTFPKFNSPIVSLKFSDKADFVHWYNEALMKQFHWVEIQTPSYLKDQLLQTQTITTKIPETRLYTCQGQIRQKLEETLSDVDCKAKLLMHEMSDGSIVVGYYWKHSDHVINDMTELVASALPIDIQNWLEEHANTYMNWKAIKNLLRIIKRNPLELKIDNSSHSFPVSLYNHYQDVQVIVDSRISKASKKSQTEADSISLWMRQLKSEDYVTLSLIGEGQQTFVLSWVSLWQKKLLQNAQDWGIDYIHNTYNLSGKEDKITHIFTIVVKDPATEKGVPVCFLVTDNEVTSALSLWFFWLKSNFKLQVKQIITDSFSTEVFSIIASYNNNITVTMSHWHIEQAWETQIENHASVVGSFQKTYRLQKRVREFLDCMMHAPNEASFHLSLVLFKIEFKKFSSFIKYFEQNWVVKKELWCKAWREPTSFDFNNFMESYHAHLKPFYPGSVDPLRVDRLIYLLSQAVMTDYQQESSKALHGNSDRQLTEIEVEREREVLAIKYSKACTMVEHTGNKQYYKCKSVKKKDIAYDVKSHDGFLNFCDCEEAPSLCKHIFLVSRIYHLPLSLSKHRKATAVLDTERYLKMFVSTVRRVAHKFRNSPDKLALIKDILQEYLKSLDIVETSHL
ncbi:uncharacterized protein EV154DRAFT_605713 [Mucor mucedo]|uniref:uncharacterized protein n=1 Tax=Mucor mucedo TaxID=29922 RepID=UPI002220EC41|nr:uncharacterized protein EV154DRAFT_605713 [Mucor mucedo]KAI7885962.1 hypothetical protein EV154DRAFT_605713 [Mucor mucedo]